MDWTGLGAMEVGALHSQSKQSERMKTDEEEAVVVVMMVITGHKKQMRCKYVRDRCGVSSEYVAISRKHAPRCPSWLRLAYSMWQKSQNKIK